VDPFALVLIGGLVALIIWVALLGKYAPGSGLDQLGLKSAREITERRAELEAEDLDQMLEAHNRRRVARGEPSLSSSDLEMQVMSEINAQRRRDQQEIAARRDQTSCSRRPTPAAARVGSPSARATRSAGSSAGHSRRRPRCPWLVV
jgi:hypothetical protein